MRHFAWIGLLGAWPALVISALPLGNREKLLVVKVGEQQVLLGMTPTNINLLCQLETPLAEPAATMPFAAQLAKLMKPGQATTDAATNQGSKDEA